METIEIKKVECIVNHEGLDNVIESVEFMYTLSAESGESVSLYSSCKIDLPDAELFVPFSELVENDPRVIDWVLPKVSDAVKNAAQRMLADKLDPRTKVYELGNPNPLS